MIAHRQPSSEDITFLVLILGFAGDRAFYLLRRRRAGDGLALAGEVLSFVIGAAGVLAGLTV
jgi:hypothetical protein